MKYLLILFILLVSCSPHPRLFSNNGSLILKKKINKLIVESDLRATMGISVVSLKTGKPIYELNSEKLLMPASNNKLFTCAAALDFLSISNVGSFEIKIFFYEFFLLVIVC